MKIILRYMSGTILVWLACLFMRRISQAILADSIPLLAIQQTIGSVFGLWTGICFSFTQLLANDALTHNVGIWTVGVIGATLCASLVVALITYTKQRPISWWHPIAAFIIYDIITGLCMGPLVWNQPFITALAGQIPHTCLHLITTGIWWSLFHAPVARALQAHKDNVLTNEARVE